MRRQIVMDKTRIVPVDEQIIQGAAESRESNTCEKKAGYGF